VTRAIAGRLTGCQDNGVSGGMRNVPLRIRVLSVPVADGL
jgi:hypothetical protein